MHHRGVDGLAEVLRAWRDRTPPEAVGLPAQPGRRTPGLRREELAALAQVSVEYVVRLEQGRAQHPSPQLLGALARALRLTEEERDHLYRVAGAAPPSPTLVPRHIPAGVQRVADRLGDLPVAIFSAAWDLLQQNALWTAVGGEPVGGTALSRNVAWRHFTGAPGPMDFDAVHEEDFSRDLAADLRDASGRYPDDPGLQDLIRRLRAASPAFQRLWAEARVSRHRTSRKTATRTPVGPITIDCDVLAVPGSDLRIVVYSAPAGSDDASRLDLLRVTGGGLAASGAVPDGVAGRAG